MKALRGYGPEPLYLAAYWPVLTGSGDLQSLHVCTPDGTRLVTSWQELARSVIGGAVRGGQSVWFVGPDAGQVGNVFALRQLLREYAVNRGVFGNGRGLWSLDVHELDAEGRHKEQPLLCLRDAAALLGEPRPFIPCSAEDARIRAEMLRDALAEVHRTLSYNATPVGMTLPASGASWVRHELVPGGRGAASRKLAWHTQGACSAAPTGELIESAPDWMSTETRTPSRKRRWPDDVPQPDAWEWEPRTDEFAKPAYYGGRVEAWRSDLPRGYLFDQRSAYADAMQWGLPTRFVRMGAGEAPDEGFVIAEASVVVPPSVLVPPLPYRLKSGPHAGQVFYPVGAWDGTYTLEELQAAKQCGASYRIKRWWLWECTPWLAPYVQRWWAYRQRCHAERNAVGYSVAKTMLNGLYGKFAQSDEFETITTDILAFDAAIKVGRNPGRWLVPVEGQKECVALYRIPETRSAALRHTAVAAAVAARVRVQITLMMHSVRMRGGMVGYVNTDGIATDLVVRTGDGLGDFRLDLSFDRAEFLADRCVGFLRDRRWDIRANGFAMFRGDTESEASYTKRCNDAWTKLRDKGYAEYEVTRGLRRGIELGNLRYRTELVRYAPRDGTSIPKRILGRDGESAPWRLADLRKHAGSAA